MAPSAGTSSDTSGRRRDEMKDAARRANRDPKVRGFGRAGLIANGVIHVLIGGIGIGVAWGSKASADQSGALRTVSDIPGGPFPAVGGHHRTVRPGAAAMDGSRAGRFEKAPTRDHAENHQRSESPRLRGHRHRRRFLCARGSIDRLGDVAGMWRVLARQPRWRVRSRSGGSSRRHRGRHTRLPRTDPQLP